ncbi:MAG: hypothetical protein ACFFKA_03655 [Candidatus Thorarchaeota archaeon]
MQSIKAILYQLGSTTITFVLSFLIPLLNMIQLKNLIIDSPSLSYLLTITELNLYLTVFIGPTLTGIRYYLSNFPKQSVKRSWLNLCYYALALVLIIGISQFSTLTITEINIIINFNLSGITTLLIFAWGLLFIKPTYTLIIFKFAKTPLERIQKRILIKCSNCNYTCKKTWKECPICKSSL